MADTEERTEQTTATRRRQARERGQVAQSRDLSAALTLLTVFLFLRYAVPPGVTELREAMGRLLGAALRPETLGLASAVTTLEEVAMIGGALFVPVALILWTSTYLAGVVQTGFLFRPAAAAPQLGRLSPQSGVGRLVSPRATGRGFFAALKLAMLALVLVQATQSFFPGEGELHPAFLLTAPLSAAAGRGMEVLLSVGSYAALALLSLAVLDWLCQRWLTERDLRMTRREVLEEHRQQEVGPEARTGRRRVRSALARRSPGIEIVERGGEP